MNDVRHLTIVGILVVGMLGLGAPTAFAGSSENWKKGTWKSCTEKDGQCTSQTWGSSGNAVYNYKDRSYEIVNRTTNNQPVAVHFYPNGTGRTFWFSSCDRVNNQGCHGKLPPGPIDSICMETGVLNNGGDRTNPGAYEYGPASCLGSNS